MSKFARRFPNRYEIVFDICGSSIGKGISINGYNSTSSTDHMSCGISASDLELFSQRIKCADYILSESGGAMVIIRNGVERVAGPDLLNAILLELNRLIDELLCVAPEYGTKISFNLNNSRVDTTNTVQLGNRLESWFSYLNPPTLGGNSGYQVCCQLGSSATLTVGTKKYSLNNGDLYLVSESFSAEIGRQ